MKLNNKTMCDNCMQSKNIYNMYTVNNTNARQYTNDFAQLLKLIVR